MSDHLLEHTLKALDDIKAQQVVHIDVRMLTSIADDMVICTGRSSRHLRSIANTLKDHLSPYCSVSIDGLDSLDWVLVDAKDVIVHIMSSDARAFYRLESLWGEGLDDMDGVEESE